MIAEKHKLVFTSLSCCQRSVYGLERTTMLQVQVVCVGHGSYH